MPNLYPILVNTLECVTETYYNNNWFNLKPYQFPTHQSLKFQPQRAFQKIELNEESEPKGSKNNKKKTPNSSTRGQKTWV